MTVVNNYCFNFAAMMCIESETGTDSRTLFTNGHVKLCFRVPEIQNLHLLESWCPYFIYFKKIQKTFWILQFFFAVFALDIVLFCGCLLVMWHELFLVKILYQLKVFGKRIIGFDFLLSFVFFYIWKLYNIWVLFNNISFVIM